jgi:pilus assembly protein TadC
VQIVGWALLAVVLFATDTMCNRLPMGRGYTIALALGSSIATAVTIVLIGVFSYALNMARWEKYFFEGGFIAALVGLVAAPIMVVYIRHRRRRRERAR